MYMSYRLPEAARKQFEAHFAPDRIKHQVHLAPFTTFEIGGPADVYLEVYTADELATALQLARTMQIPHFLLGCGANILIGDLGYRGLVIRNLATSSSIDQETHRLWAESGAIMYPDIIDAAIGAGLSGLEH